MTSESNGGRSTDLVLGDALAELREREQRLLVFVEELTKVRRAIKTLERAGDVKPPAKKHPVTDFRIRVVALLEKSLEPLSVEQIADLLGRDVGPWMHANLKKMVGAGQIVRVEGGYGVPDPILDGER